jgi:diacylglycerol kinase family enzyme
VHVQTGTEVTLSADRPIPVGADGELIGELPVTVRIRPGALKVIAPPG